MEDFVRKTKGVRDINSLPLSANHELDMVADVKGKIYIKILNRYKELLFDNGTEQWVIDMLNNLEVDVEQLKEDILDIERSLSELPMIEDKLKEVEAKLTQLDALFTQLQTDVNGLDLRTAELEREVIQLALKDQELLDKINNLDLEFIYSNSNDFEGYDDIGNFNLLNAPYYLSKVPLGENIASTAQTFPIVTSSETLYGRSAMEDFIVGQTYTVTMKATKPSTQSLVCYLSEKQAGTFTPVEGLTDVWSTTIKINQLGNSKRAAYISQKPNTTLGTCQIDWIKIEKGETRTPNILYYKYVGISLEGSKNPNDFHWIPLAKAAEIVDDKLTKTITTYDTVNALQNNRLTALESKVVDTAWTNVTPISPFTAAQQIQVKRQNGVVYMRGVLSDGTGDCFTLPEGFRPPNDGYEYHYLLPGRSRVQTDAAKIYVKPNGLCTIVSKTGTTPIFLEPIQFSAT